jgi:hypothetical protein
VRLAQPATSPRSLIAPGPARIAVEGTEIVDAVALRRNGSKGAQRERYVERSEIDQRRRELVQELPQLRAHAEVLNSVLAVDVARSLGADIHGATQVAPRIVDGAKDLRASDPSRPPGRPSRDGSVG